ncbi:recombinase family protein [Amycolatopsis magusensis]|uniref:DNA invertase Pin-like site-specific DNA recombinase n=1 Tax=Amycolatopsis magusensis TaxID=882444 RepID=A0ABS4PTW5_9PSEU|nr:recombinase family protein [Amycolatopsis magusensis]MBP2182867.1 DNA invertase Pin-like site-specific DNA recombinase [Amycolatopsis magusensis]
MQSPPCKQAFGYLQVKADSPDEVVQQTEHALREFAADHDLQLTDLFFDDGTGSRQAFDAMVIELQQQRTTHVLVPSMRHFARNPLLQNMMLDRLRHAADAQVLELFDEETS